MNNREIPLEMQQKYHRAEWIEFVAAELIDAELSIEKDYVTDELRYRLATHIAGLESHTEVVFCDYPQCWWQHLKQRFAPAWFLRKWPVIETNFRREIKVYKALCPHIPRTDNNKRCLEWMSAMEESSSLFAHEPTKD